jgi:DNA-binding transcriptional ArsR family regulator/uncharacterized protein YndB with AHSA1/START domain
MSSNVEQAEKPQEVWRALSNPIRRGLLDLLADGPRTTGELADEMPDLSRFAVMQHLGVMVDADLVLVRRRGRHRYNYLNPAPLAEWYHRWVSPIARRAAEEAIALRLHVEKGVEEMGDGNAGERVRTVRIESELRFDSTPERVFRALTDETLEWFPHTYGENRTKAVIVEPKVGGLHYEDWGEGRGHLYGHVTVYDPPHQFSTRGRLMPGTILDSEYKLELDGDGVVLAMTKTAVGAMTDEEAASIRTFGDISRFAEPLRQLVEAG